MSWPLFRMTSGATYSGVPQNVHVFRPACTNQKRLLDVLPDPSNRAQSLYTTPERKPHLQFLGEPEIDQFHVALRIEQQILRFQVAVDDAATVQVFKRLDDAGRVETGGRVVEIPAVPQNGPQLATQTGFHQHVQVLSVFKSLVQLDYEIAIGFFHDLFLRHDVLLLPRLDNLSTSERERDTRTK